MSDVCVRKGCNVRAGGASLRACCVLQRCLAASMLRAAAVPRCERAALFADFLESALQVRDLVLKLVVPLQKHTHSPIAEGLTNKRSKKQTNKQTNKQSNDQRHKDTNKDTKKQRHKETKKQSNKQGNGQTNKGTTKRPAA
jgi:hypothetical protein